MDSAIRLSCLVGNFAAFENSKFSNGAGDIAVAAAMQQDRLAVIEWRPSREEKELVQRTWSDDFAFLYELGAAIYTYIFEHNPHTRQLFPGIHRHGEEGWRDSAEFRSQALRFAQALSQAVKNIYRMEDAAAYFYSVGQRHVKYGASRGFKPAYWDIFQDAIEHALIDHINSIPDLSAGQVKEAMGVWRRLALFIITHMRRGFFSGSDQC